MIETLVEIPDAETGEVALAVEYDTITRDVVLVNVGRVENTRTRLEPLALTVLVDGLRDADKRRSEAAT